MGKRKRHSPEQIVAKLRQGEVQLAKGQSVPAVCRKVGISEQTYYRWRKEYGGGGVEQATRLKALEAENERLKRVLAHQALYIAILTEAAEGNG